MFCFRPTTPDLTLRYSSQYRTMYPELAARAGLKLSSSPLRPQPGFLRSSSAMEQDDYGRGKSRAGGETGLNGHYQHAQSPTGYLQCVENPTALGPVWRASAGPGGASGKAL